MTDITKSIEALLAQKEAQRVQIIREMQLDPNVKYTGQMARGVLYELDATIENLKQLLNPYVVKEPKVEAVIEPVIAEEPIVSEEPIVEEQAPELEVVEEPAAEEQAKEDPEAEEEAKKKKSKK